MKNEIYRFYINLLKFKVVPKRHFNGIIEFIYNDMDIHLEAINWALKNKISLDLVGFHSTFYNNEELQNVALFHSQIKLKGESLLGL